MDNYEITVKWPTGRTFTRDGYTQDQAQAMADFLWACGADDVKLTCVCGECETCRDRAVAQGLDR
jgi:hypothetical protein